MLRSRFLPLLLLLAVGCSPTIAIDENEIDANARGVTAQFVPTRSPVALDAVFVVEQVTVAKLPEVRREKTREVKCSLESFRPTADLTGASLAHEMNDLLCRLCPDGGRNEHPERTKLPKKPFLRHAIVKNVYSFMGMRLPGQAQGESLVEKLELLTGLINAQRSLAKSSDNLLNVVPHEDRVRSKEVAGRGAVLSGHGEFTAYALFGYQYADGGSRRVPGKPTKSVDELVRIYWRWVLGGLRRSLKVDSLRTDHRYNLAFLKMYLSSEPDEWNLLVLVNGSRVGDPTWQAGRRRAILPVLPNPEPEMPEDLVGWTVKTKARRNRRH